MQRKFWFGINVLRSDLRVWRSALGKGRENISIVIAMAALKCIVIKERHKSIMSMVTKIMEESLTSESRQYRNSADKDVNKKLEKCGG